MLQMALVTQQWDKYYTWIPVYCCFISSTKKKKMKPLVFTILFFTFRFSVLSQMWALAKMCQRQNSP